MTPEEKAVIEAAIIERHALGSMLSRTDLAVAVDALLAKQAFLSDGETAVIAEDTSEPVWVPATLGMCLVGDRIRIGQQESAVLKSSAGVWYADVSNYRQPRAWKHTELRLDLDANPGLQQYPASAACEILCTPERKAALLLQEAFPGSAYVSSDVD